MLQHTFDANGYDINIHVIVGPMQRRFQCCVTVIERRAMGYSISSLMADFVHQRHLSN